MKTAKKAAAKNRKVIHLKSQDSKESVSIQTIPTEQVQVSHHQSHAESMIDVALKSGRSMEEIGKLIEYRNAEIARLAKLAFIEAKKDFTKLRGRIVKSNDADFGTTKSGSQGAKYKFEDLDAIEIAVKDVAASCGLTYDWKPRYEGDWIYITCILSHIGGHSEEVTMRGKADSSGGKNSIQAEASTVSYLMRYTLKQVMGLSTGKDDDDGHKSGKPVAPEKTDGLPFATDEQYKAIIHQLITKVIKFDEALKIFSYTDEQLESLKIIAE